jgi:lipopolysaccharide export system protein LptA
MKTSRRLAGCTVLLLVAAAALPAETIRFASDTINVRVAMGGERALLNGHAWVQSQDLRITADSIELFGADYIYAQCHGSVHVVDSKRGLDLTSQELFYDRDQKVARIKGNAVMYDLKNEMTVKGGFIEDRDTEQITLIQIGVRIFKKDIVCRAEFARYRRDTKILELSGMPWVSKAGDIYQAARITINLDTEEITLEGSVQGTIEDKGKSETGKTTPTGQETPGGNPAVPGDATAAPPAGTPAPVGRAPTGAPAPQAAPAAGGAQGSGTPPGKGTSGDR